MPRTASDGVTIEQLREQAKRMFPGKTAIIIRLNKEQLKQAIATGILPDVQVPQYRPAVSPAPSLPSMDGNTAAQQIANAIESLTQSFPRPVSEGDIRAIAEDVFCTMLQDMPRTELTIRINDLPPVSVDGQHERFPVLLALTAARVPVMMVGPAGSGKTTAAANVAHSLGLAFHATACNEQMTPAGLLGYMDATGNYVQTEFRRAYENGGIFLLDEMDRGRPGVLATLNMAFANGHMAFPDGLIERHPDCIILAGANTFGTGGDRQYNTAQQLDGATLDRFFALRWDYDRSLTRSLMGLLYRVHTWSYAHPGTRWSLGQIALRQ